MNQRFRVGVDIGGTFTDLIVVDSETGRFSVGKVLTTPADPSQAVETVLLKRLLCSKLIQTNSTPDSWHDVGHQCHD